MIRPLDLSPRHEMSRKPKQLAVNAQAKAGSWKWIILAGVVLGTGFAALGYLLSSDSDSIALDLADNTPPKMVRIPGGTFVMGRDDGPEDERPPHEVTVAPFEMDETEVTNSQFAAFVKATGYVTVAEQKPDSKKYPDVPEE